MNIGWAAILIGLAVLAWALWIFSTEEPSDFEGDFDDSYTPVDLSLLGRADTPVVHYDQDECA